MPTLEFQALNRRKVKAGFTGGRVSSDGGAMLLGELDRRTGISERFAACFDDLRNPLLTEHSVLSIVRQRILGLCLGYEDLNDHDTLRGDALLATAVGKADPTGADRRMERDRGNALAGKSTLNRLELTEATASAQERYKKIVARDDDIERFFVEEFIDSYVGEVPHKLVLDIDPTDIELYGRQEGRFFHGYYDHYCYLPLLMFCGQHLLLARLRSSNIDGCLGTVDALKWLVPQLREQWPGVDIELRADSGFARDEILTWCEMNDVEYVIGLAKNSRLLAKIETELEQSRQLWKRTSKASRVYSEFNYRTQDSWSRERRIIAKAEHLPGKSNPRFVVTSYPQHSPQTLYEHYCERGEMENRIKEHQLDLFGDRASCHPMRANQLRLWLSSVAYVLMTEFRKTALKNTDLERAQTNTIRTRLLKLGTIITVSVRRVYLAFSSVFPAQAVFMKALENIQAAYAP